MQLLSISEASFTSPPSFTTVNRFTTRIKVFDANTLKSAWGDPVGFCLYVVQEAITREDGIDARAHKLFIHII